MEPETQERQPWTWAFVIYQQIMSCLGVFALIALAGHIVSVDWHWFIQQPIELWNNTARPAVAFLLDVTVVALLRWAVDFHLEIPLALRDYLSVGIVFSMSRVRAANIVSPTMYWSARDIEKDFPLHNLRTKIGLRVVSFIFNLVTDIGIFSKELLIWPYHNLIRVCIVLLSIADAWRKRAESTRERAASLKLNKKRQQELERLKNQDIGPQRVKIADELAQSLKDEAERALRWSEREERRWYQDRWDQIYQDVLIVSPLIYFSVLLLSNLIIVYS